MLQLPPMPTWDAMHPLLIHFPIVLLLISPLFICHCGAPASAYESALYDQCIDHASAGNGEFVTGGIKRRGSRGTCGPSGRRQCRSGNA